MGVLSGVTQGGRDLVGVAGQVTRAGPELLGLAVHLAGRVTALVGRAEDALQDVIRLLGRVDELVGAVDATRRRADALTGDAGQTITRVREVTDGADQAITRVREVTDGADQAITRVGELSDAAAGVLDRAETLVDGAEELLRQVRPLTDALTALPPDTLRRLVDVTARIVAALPDELIDALPALLAAAADAAREGSTAPLARLLREAPDLLDQLDGVVVPGYRLLEGMGPEVSALRELGERLEPVAVDLATRLAGLPGMKRAKQRGLADPDLQHAADALHADEKDGSDHAHRTAARDRRPGSSP